MNNSTANKTRPEVNHDYMRYTKEYLADQLEAVDTENAKLREALDTARQEVPKQSKAWYIIVAALEAGDG
jgi:hypothetical protein